MAEREAYQHKVQYYETDQMGIVHHSNYIRWFEEARTDYMDRLGMGYARMEEMGILSPVLSVSADYLRMVYFGVTAGKTGMVHCKGVSKHCFINREGRPLSLKHSAPEFHEMFLAGKEAAKEDHRK